MTAGSYVYIGPQGIVHGTTVNFDSITFVMIELSNNFRRKLKIKFLLKLLFILQLTVLNAGRKYLGLNDLSGKVFLTSGLGGMNIKFISQLRRFYF
jgi:urocanate hydratase